MNKAGLHVQHPETGETSIIRKENDTIRDWSGIFSLHYQAVVNIHSEETVGYEALLRILHKPDDLSPQQFIHHVERNPSFVIWLLKQAHRALVKMQGVRPGLFVGINICPTTVDQDFVKAFRSLVPEKYLRSLLGIELIERAPITDTTRESIAKLHHEDQVHFLLDDVADLDSCHGISSIAENAQFIQGIKLPKKYVRAAADDEYVGMRDDLEEIVRFTHDHGMRCVYEGIESEVMLNYPRTFSSQYPHDKCQGYHFHRPSPLEEVLRSLSSH